MTAAFPPLLLLGAGKMGGALYAGWCAAGLAPSVLVDPAAPASLARPQDRLVVDLAHLTAGFRPEAVLLCIKPRKAGEVLPALRPLLPPGVPVISIMAGIRASALSAALGVPVLRAMPNTPAAIGHGITGCFAQPDVPAAARDLADRLMRAVGETVWLDAEDQIDVVTGISGSGPAYVFLLAELLASAGETEGLPPAQARALARGMISGAGALLAASPEEAAELRRRVTSPGGTTAAALDVLMAPQAWPRAVPEAVHAAILRARALASG